MQLDFRKYTPADAPIVRRLVSGQPYRSCDFTVGGLLLWADYYGYEFAVADDTLFVRGRAEDGRPAYLLPVGALPPVQSVAALCGYCRARGERPLLSFVPQEAAEAVAARIPCRLEQLAVQILQGRHLPLVSTPHIIPVHICGTAVKDGFLLC